ncbi:SGNH/GDSL hydrolase family protein [Streptomyces sp. NPDC048506]|uniref:SGNH/GDSL hydrolase family protein n=1 Tax=Streptomyces sp. NPDC048506 TaxID=3155028 RepID=UPI0034156249
MSRCRMPALARLALAGLASLAAVGASLAPPSSPAAAADRPEYVALGDSYSAGVFVRLWEEKDGCGRSGRNYPHQVAARLGYALKDRTCGAAEVVDGVLAPQPASKVYGPPTTPPPGGWRSLPAQVDALSDHTRVVTVSIGGNSLGFGPIMTKCLTLGATTPWSAPCRRYFGQGEGKAWLDGRFAALGRDFGRMMGEIHDRARHARVAVVGYPAIAADGSGCGYLHWDQLGSVKKGDIPWLDELEQRLNRLLEEQAVRHRATYVDTYGPSVRHGVCESGEAKWMYGIRDDLTGDGDQTDQPPSQECLKIPGSGQSCTFVHPNARGLDNQAHQVIRALTSGR